MPLYLLMDKQGIDDESRFRFQSIQSLNVSGVENPIQCKEWTHPVLLNAVWYLGLSKWVEQHQLHSRTIDAYHFCFVPLAYFRSLVCCSGNEIPHSCFLSWNLQWKYSWSSRQRCKSHTGPQSNHLRSRPFASHTSSSRLKGIRWQRCSSPESNLASMFQCARLRTIDGQRQ